MNEDTLKKVVEDLTDMENTLFIMESRGETPKISPLRESLLELVQSVNTYREKSATYVAMLNSQIESLTKEGSE